MNTILSIILTAAALAQAPAPAQDICTLTIMVDVSASTEQQSLSCQAGYTDTGPAVVYQQ